MNLNVATYLIYLLVAVPLTIWVARTLSRNGRIFLIDVFHGNAEFADAVNRLLVAGFYLVNLGFVTLFLRTDAAVIEVRGVFEQLSVKLGTVMVVLGVLHLSNVWIFNAIRRRNRIDEMTNPPVVPNGVLPMGALTGSEPPVPSGY